MRFPHSIFHGFNPFTLAFFWLLCHLILLLEILSTVSYQNLHSTLWGRSTENIQHTSNCLKKTLVRVSRKCEGQRMDSMITTLLSRGLTRRCLQQNGLGYTDCFLKWYTIWQHRRMHDHVMIPNTTWINSHTGVMAHKCNLGLQTTASRYVGNVFHPHLKYNMWMNSFRIVYSSSVLMLYCTTLMGCKEGWKANHIYNIHLF